MLRCRLVLVEPHALGSGKLSRKRVGGLPGHAVYRDLAERLYERHMAVEAAGGVTGVVSALTTYTSAATVTGRPKVVES